MRAVSQWDLVNECIYHNFMFVLPSVVTLVSHLFLPFLLSKHPVSSLSCEYSSLRGPASIRPLVRCRFPPQSYIQNEIYQKMQVILMPVNQTRPPPVSSHHKTHPSMHSNSVGGIVSAGVKAIIGAELITPYLKCVCLIGNNIKQDMKQVILIIALLGLAFAGILHGSTAQILARTPNPNDILRQVRFEPLEYCDPVVEVKLSEIHEGWHGEARDQFFVLYPAFRTAPITRCFYSALGRTRFYTYTITVNGLPQNVSTAIQVDDKVTESASSPDKDDGFSQVSITFAEKDPSISFAINVVIKNNWDVIKGNPLEACWTRPVLGVWEYRFYFRNVKGRFEYSQKETTQSTTENKGESKYFADVQPVFVVGETAQYKDFDLEAFKKTPEYNAVVVQLTQSLGKFDEKWILNVSVSVSAGVNYIKVTVNFQPFLLKQEYEAQYYGSVEKAALLKIDERVFNANGRSYQDWQEIKDFGSYRAFAEASKYAQSQFTWLRFYSVVAAYSALHKQGRFVRLVYNGISTYVDPKNQINIVIFIDECGKYFIDRNDFLATNLDSYGRNNWVSLFIHTPDVSKAKFYQQIVKFYQNIYPKFWSANQLVDIRFKDNLHVIQFKNPTYQSVSVINVNNEKVQVLNNFNWILLSNNSPLLGRIENLVRGKNDVSSIMFIQYRESTNGTHFEIGFLDSKKLFKTAYLLYIPANDAFTDGSSAAFSAQEFANDTYNNPLPKDLNLSLLTFFEKLDIGCTAVISYVVLAPRQFAVIAVVNGSRWQIVVDWVEQAWSIVSSQPHSDGYYVARGIPSASAASCAGFLRRLYPQHFASPFTYVLVETRTVGINLYNRLVLTVGNKAHEAVVSTTFGVSNSHILQSYSPVLFVRPKEDYGYGKAQIISYGVPASYFYEHAAPKKSNLSAEPEKNQTIAVLYAPEKDECPAGTRLVYGNCLPDFRY